MTPRDPRPSLTHRPVVSLPRISYGTNSLVANREKHHRDRDACWGHGLAAVPFCVTCSGMATKTMLRGGTRRLPAVQARPSAASTFRKARTHRSFPVRKALPAPELAMSVPRPASSTTSPFPSLPLDSRPSRPTPPARHARRSHSIRQSVRHRRPSSTLVATFPLANPMRARSSLPGA